jgi:hypothetical protein
LARAQQIASANAACAASLSSGVVGARKEHDVDWRFNTIWHDQLAKGAFRSVDFTKPSSISGRLLDSSYVRALRFKSKTANLAGFPAKGTVKCLELVWANIRSFSGVSCLGKVKRLEAHYCLKLESDSGLSQIRSSLEWLHINQSKKFSPGKELLGLRNLKVLCLNNCGSLDDLEFLRAFPNLLDFRFVDTTVLSGDLTPILEHPTLCSVGFLNKRHYNKRDAEIDEHLAPRARAATKKAYKGQYETFRYLAVGAPDNKRLQSIARKTRYG